MKTLPRTVHFDTNVAGGFPVSVTAEIYPPEPDVGIFHPYVDHFALGTEDGRPADFIERRMTASDWERLEEAALAAL